MGTSQSTTTVSAPVSAIVTNKAVPAGGNAPQPLGMTVVDSAINSINKNVEPRVSYPHGDARPGMPLNQVSTMFTFAAFPGMDPKHATYKLTDQEKFAKKVAVRCGQWIIKKGLPELGKALGKKGTKKVTGVIGAHITAPLKAYNGDGAGAAGDAAGAMLGLGGWIIGAAGFGPAGAVVGLMGMGVGAFINAFDDSAKRAMLTAKAQQKDFQKALDKDMELMIDCPWRPAFPCGCSGVLSPYAGGEGCSYCGKQEVSYICLHGDRLARRSQRINHEYCFECYAKAVRDGVPVLKNSSDNPTGNFPPRLYNA